MGKVIVDLSMSLDGYIAGPNDGPGNPLGDDGDGQRGSGLCAADVAQQFLRAGLLDEIQVSVAPIVLGGGVPLFDQSRSGPVELEQTRVIESEGVTHLRYRVVK